MDRLAINRYRICCGVLAATWVVSLHAQKATLTTAEIQRAVDVGTKARSADFGLVFKTDGFGSDYGIRVELLTPLNWIATRAAQAARQFEPLTADRVDAEMLRPVLRVIVDPTPSEPVAAEEIEFAASVERVVLTTVKGDHVLHPAAVSAFDVHLPSAQGSKPLLRGLRAEFLLTDLASLRAKSNKAGEFVVVVIGDHKTERAFEVKKRLFVGLD